MSIVVIKSALIEVVMEKEIKIDQILKVKKDMIVVVAQIVMIIVMSIVVIKSAIIEVVIQIEIIQ